MKNLIITLSFIITSIPLIAQETEFSFPSFSPKGIISQTVGNTLIEVEYERPSVRKRQIYGGLVPWNKVWRTGAGKCTKIRFDKDVKIKGQKVPAGSYSIFTIPNPKEWIVIINKDTTLYGSYDYNYKDDITRFVVIPTETDRFYETFNFDIEIFRHNARMYISWANTQISFEIETSANTEMDKLIREELLTNKNQIAYNYAAASSYLFYLGKDLSTALKLADKAIEMDKEMVWIRNVKIGIYESLHLYANALEEINQYLIILQKDKEKHKNEIRQLELDHERINKLRE
jgi:hypothetical protein